MIKLIDYSYYLKLKMIEHDDRTSFSKYYTPKDEKKDFNLSIHGKMFLICQNETKDNIQKTLMRLMI